MQNPGKKPENKKPAFRLKSFFFILPVLLATLVTLGANIGFLFLLSQGIPATSAFIQLAVLMAPIIINTIAFSVILRLIARKATHVIQKLNQSGKNDENDERTQDHSKKFASALKFIQLILATTLFLIAVVGPTLPFALLALNKVPFLQASPLSISLIILIGLTLTFGILTISGGSQILNGKDQTGRNNTEEEYELYNVTSQQLVKKSLGFAIVTTVLALATNIVSSVYLRSILTQLTGSDFLHTLIMAVGPIIGIITLGVGLALITRPHIARAWTNMLISKITERFPNMKDLPLKNGANYKSATFLDIDTQLLIAKTDEKLRAFILKSDLEGVISSCKAGGIKPPTLNQAYKQPTSTPS